MPAAFIMERLKQHKAVQTRQRLKAGKLWENSVLVFTNEIGQPLTKETVYRDFKRAAATISKRYKTTSAMRPPLLRLMFTAM